MALIDHGFSYCRNNSLDEALRFFERCGFLIDPERTRHAWGLMTGFIALTGTYLEFFTVVDEQEWGKEGDETDRFFRKACRPHGFALRCTQIESAREKLSRIAPGIEPCFSKGRKDGNDLEPIWKICPLPASLAPGCYIFAIETLRRVTERSKLVLRVSPNSVFGLAGLVFCSEERGTRIEQWSRTLTQAGIVIRREDSSISLGVQRLQWLDEKEYRDAFSAPWFRLSHPRAEVAAIRLLAEDLDVASEFFLKNNLPVSKQPGRLIVGPDPNSGFAFWIEPGNSREYFDQLSRDPVFTPSTQA